MQNISKRPKTNFVKASCTIRYKEFGYKKKISFRVTEFVATELIFFDMNWWAKKQKSP